MPDVGRGRRIRHGRKRARKRRHNLLRDAAEKLENNAANDDDYENETLLSVKILFHSKSAARPQKERLLWK